MPQRFMVQVALLGGLVLLPRSPASAADRSAVLTGAGLEVDSPCAIQVMIQPDQGLQGHSTVIATAEHQEELDRLVFDTQGTPRISTGRRDCWRPSLALSFTPTLKLKVQVPPGTKLSVNESGKATYALGDFGGPLTVSISGVADIQAGRTTSLEAALSGAGNVSVAAIDGTAAIEISGQGAVNIESASISKLTVDLSGLGSFALRSGSVATAKLQDSGAGTIEIGAIVGDVVADLSGIGSVHLAHVTGSIHKTISGMGSVTVGDGP